MSPRRLFRRLIPACLLAAGLAGAASAQARSPFPASGCTDPISPLSQPFAPFGDSNWYAPLPGQDADNFAGTGWRLRGGAALVSATLADGSTGTVLDMPAGSIVSSPSFCVTSSYVTGRALVQSIGGSSALTGYVVYDDGTVHVLGNLADQAQSSWSLTTPFNMQPNSSSARGHVVLVASPTPGENQLYDFFVDPRMG